jgi:hypothetical protein
MKFINSITKRLLAAVLPVYVFFFMQAATALAQVQNPGSGGGGGGGGGLIPRGKIHPDTSAGFFNYLWAAIGLIAAIFGALSIIGFLSGARKGISSIDSEMGMNSRAFTKSGASLVFAALCLGGGIFLLANQGLRAVGIS